MLRFKRLSHGKVEVTGVHVILSAKSNLKISNLYVYVEIIIYVWLCVLNNLYNTFMWSILRCYGVGKFC